MLKYKETVESTIISAIRGYDTLNETYKGLTPILQSHTSFRLAIFGFMTKADDERESLEAQAKAGTNRNRNPPL